MKLLPATSNERLLVWCWANDPTTRANSFNQDPITWEEHCKWFDAQQNLLIGWAPVGVVRLAHGEISVNVDPDQRGKGFGQALIRAASVPNTKARIKDSNAASLRAFRAAQYTEISREDGVVTMVWPGLQ